MSDYLTGLKQFIEGRVLEASEIQNHLTTFRENLYTAIEEQVSFLRLNGLEAVVGEAKRDDSGRELEVTINGLNLKYVPLEGVAYDDNTPFEDKFERVPTGRLLVFPDSPDSTPSYSYWINRAGEWTGAGIGRSPVANVQDVEAIREHVRMFISDLFTQVRKHWNPLNTVRLGDVDNGDEPLGFRAPGPDGQMAQVK